MANSIVEVTFCGDCPFCNLHYDSFEPDSDTVATCGLKRFYGQYFTISSCDTKLGEELDLDIPKWCPLDEVTVKRWM